MLNRNMPIGTAIAALKKQIADRQSATFILEALIATGASAPEPVTDRSLQRRRRSKRGGASTGQAAVEILRAAGRPLHATREILPALVGRGFNVAKTGLPTTLARNAAIVRVGPGTFGLKPDAEGSSDTTDKKLKASA